MFVFLNDLKVMSDKFLKGSTRQGLSNQMLFPPSCSKWITKVGFGELLFYRGTARTTTLLVPATDPLKQVLLEPRLCFSRPCRLPSGTR